MNSAAASHLVPGRQRQLHARLSATASIARGSTSRDRGVRFRFSQTTELPEPLRRVSVGRTTDPLHRPVRRTGSHNH